MIVGMSGYAQSGKDSVADYLVDHYGFTKAGFADKLRELVAFIDPFVWWGSTWLRYSEVLDVIGYERAKRETNAREILVGVGDGVRKILGKDTWVNAALMDLDRTKNYVFTDVRFPNEFDGVREWAGGEVWRIERPGVGPALDSTGKPYESDVAIDDFAFDFVIANDGGLFDLRRVVDGLMQNIKRETMVR